MSESAGRVYSAGKPPTADDMELANPAIPSIVSPDAIAAEMGRCQSHEPVPSVAEEALAALDRLASAEDEPGRVQS